ncbi:MAG: antibiotic biosynthesis monooxygenase [Alphaproteobacteria bacterium]|nr:antibiotic biosynthesis monooxygenase [Alphaproteobacteria bacterium]
MAVKLAELDEVVTLAAQMETEEGPIVLINIFTFAPEDEDALISAWTQDADFMKQQPGYISTQLHRGLAGSSALVNYAVWQDVRSFRDAFSNPEFVRLLDNYPDSAIATPHLFKKLAVSNHCVA